MLTVSRTSAMLTVSQTSAKRLLYSATGCSWCRLEYFTRSLSSFQPHYNHGLSGKGKSRSNLPATKVPAINGEVLFGLHPVILALRAEKRKVFHQVYIDGKFNLREKRDSEMEEIFELSSNRKVPVHFMSRNVLDHLAGNRPHQGVCMDVDRLQVPQWDHQDSLTEYMDKQQPRAVTSTVPLWLLLHNVHDPMNFGAILRTSQYLGVDQVVFPSLNSCKLSPVVSKASAGALEIVNLMKLPAATSETEFCQWWQSQGGCVVGTGAVLTESDQSALIENFTVTGPTLVLLGNEGSGLSKELEECCDKILTIPGHEPSQAAGRVSSLNVSVAAGILIHYIKAAALKVPVVIRTQ